MDEPPLGTLGLADGETVLDRFVFVVCYLTIGEPPGASADAYIRDEAGVWWHGYGFTEPELGEPGYSETRSAWRRRSAGLVRPRQSRWAARRRS